MSHHPFYLNRIAPWRVATNFTNFKNIIMNISSKKLQNPFKLYIFAKS